MSEKLSTDPKDWYEFLDSLTPEQKDKMEKLFTAFMSSFKLFLSTLFMILTPEQKKMISKK